MGNCRFRKELVFLCLSLTLMVAVFPVFVLTLGPSSDMEERSLVENLGDLEGGKWSWWACALWAVLTAEQCAQGNLLTCAAMIITYSQNC